MTNKKSHPSSNTHGKSMPPKPAVKEPDQPVPQEAQKPKQQSAQGEFGEGNYKATREYNEGLKRHLETHDIEKEARDAAPNSREEAESMERAEEAGRSRADKDPEVNKNA